VNNALQTSDVDTPQFGFKVTLLACTVALLTAILVGGLYYARITELALNQGIETLLGRTLQIAPRFEASFTQMKNDAFLIANTPAVNEFVKFKRNPALEKIGALGLSDSRERVTTIFTTTLKLRPAYTKLRFIGLTDGDRELVRVNKTSDDYEIVPPQKLQRTGEEPYIVDSINLKPSESYFSAVTLNREYGKVDKTHTITIRHVSPVFDERGKLFSFIVINADYEKLIQETLKDFRLENHLVLINEAGDYIEADKGNPFSRIKFHEDSDYALSPLIKAIQPVANKLGNTLTCEDDNDFIVCHPATSNGANATSVFSDDKSDYVIAYTHVPFSAFSENAGERFLGVALVEPKSMLLEAAYKTQGQSFIIALFAIFLSPLLAWPIANAFNLHIKRLTSQLSQSRYAESRALTELKAIIENAVDGLITINGRGLIQSFNPACERIFGYMTHEVIGQNIKMLMPDKYSQHHDEYLSNYQRTREAKIIGIGREVEGRRKNGEIFPLDLSVSEITVLDNIMYSGIIRDISERKKAEKTLLASNAALLRSNAELDDFAYIASHDLKEPLRAIHNHSRFLLEDHGELLPDDAKIRINKLLTSTVRMDKLIDDLLSFSRLSRGEIAKEMHDMNALVQDVIKNIEPFLEEKKAQIIIPEPLPSVMCDRVKVVSILQNLAVNGIKYNDNFEKIIEIGFKATQPRDQHVETDVFYVKDNGIGIRSEFKNDVFRIFKRLHSPKLYGEGSGSGLTFTKKNVERHGGIIWFESVIGQGTVFYFTLKESPDV